MKVPKNIGINEYVVKLAKRKQLYYNSTYAFSLVKLEIPKIYIKTYLKTSFIGSSKSSIDAPILFDWKSDGSFCLCVIY